MLGLQLNVFFIQVTTQLIDVARLLCMYFLRAFDFLLQLLEFGLGLSQLVLSVSQLPVGELRIASPFLDFNSQRRLGLKLLLFEVLNFLLKFDVFVFVVELSLPLFLMSATKHGLLLKVPRLEVLAQLIDLPVERVDHLVLRLHDVFELDLLG